MEVEGTPGGTTSAAPDNVNFDIFDAMEWVKLQKQELRTREEEIKKVENELVQGESKSAAQVVTTSGQ